MCCSNSTGPPGARQVHRRSRQDLSRKTGEDSRSLGQLEGAEFLRELRPVQRDGLAEPYSQLTRSAGRM